MKNFDELIGLAEKLANDDIIQLSQIPNIDLYVDQVTTFLESYLQNYKRSEDDKIITKTMINNYTKDKVLPPPKQKKYSKNHMLLLIMLFHLKQSMSIGDIMKLIDIDLLKAEEIYKVFTIIQENEKNSLVDDVKIKKERIEELITVSQDNNSELLLILFSLIIDANLKKQLACRILDTLF